jgi:hypothetical protein
MQRRTTLMTVAVLGSAALIAGCGSGSSDAGTPLGSGTNNSSQSPSAELASAVGAVGKASNVTATIKIGATPSQISSLGTSHGKNISPTQASTIAGAQVSIQVQAPSGKTLADVSGSNSPDAVAFTVSDNGTNYLSLRSVKKTLYLQADLKDLLNALGKGSTYASIQAQSAALPSFVQALLAGKWISLPVSTLKALESTIGGGRLPSASPNPAQQKAFLATLQTLLAKDVTVTRISAGTTDKLAVSANVHTLGTDLMSSVTSLVPGAGTALGSSPKLPDRHVAMTASVTGGALSALSVNLGQFTKTHTASIPLTVTLTGGAPISAPSGAVAVAPAELAELFGGGLGS